MAKLQFIKLDIEIMNDSKIKMIRKMPDGAKLFELWIGLLCLGMKSGRPGCVEIGDGLPFNVRMLSAELDIPETTIELGLKTFTELRMIEQFDDSTFFLSNFEKHQELEKIEIKKINERDRKRKYRDKIKRLSHVTGQGRDGDGTKCPTVDIDIDKDIDIDHDGVMTGSCKKEEKDIYGENENVKLTKKEYQKCIDKYGEDITILGIDKLSNYKASKGKEYVSDYGALNTWVWKSLKEEQKKPIVNGGVFVDDSSPIKEAIRQDYKEAYGE